MWTLISRNTAAQRQRWATHTAQHPSPLTLYSSPSRCFFCSRCSLLRHLLIPQHNKTSSRALEKSTTTMKRFWYMTFFLFSFYLSELMLSKVRRKRFVLPAVNNLLNLVFFPTPILPTNFIGLQVTFPRPKRPQN